MSNNIRTMTHETSGKVQKIRDDSGLTISAKKSSGRLPDELLEKIVSNIPFPSLFTAKLLSKAWYFKFPLASQRIGSLCPSFQNLVSSLSFKWPTYCPVYISPEMIVGFDRASARWQTMLDFSHLPFSTWTSAICHGPLVCIMDFDERGKRLDVVITNAVTRGWRNLNFHPGVPVATKIILQGSDGYEVLMVCRAYDRLYTQVYDSRRRTCKRNDPVVVESSQIHPSSAYLDGKLYCIAGYLSVYLLMHDVEKNTWSAIPNSAPNFFWRHYYVTWGGALLCGDKIMVVLCIDEDGGPNDEGMIDQIKEDYGPYISAGRIHIYELDVVTLELGPKSSGPPDNIFGLGAERQPLGFASDSNFIYFGRALPGTAVLTYNIHSHEWSCIPPAFYEQASPNWMTAEFQPGLSPFMIV